MPDVEVNGVHIAYDRSGDGPPLVLVAGRGMPREWWTEEHVAPYLNAGYSVLRFDNRGMPPSDCPAAPFAIADLVDDAAALLDALGLSDCVVIGHSMGSLIAQELAAARPDLARAVAPIATAARHPGWVDVFNRGMIELFESGADVPDELLIGALFGQLYDPGELDDDARVMPWLEELLSEPPWDDPGRINQWRAYAGYRGDPERLARIEAPCLVVALERDLIMPLSQARAIAEAIPGSRLEVVPEAGHWGMILDPARVHGTVVDFLREAGVAPADAR
jgi:pimeloyl-ACP methyl ester carboxylesterase